MKGGKINVGEDIAKNIIDIAEKVKQDSWLGHPSTILRLCEEARVPLEEFEDTDVVSIGKPITKERLEYITTTQLERLPLRRRRRRRDAIQEEDQEEEEEQNALNMNQLQNALEGITQQYSQIQQSQQEQAQQQRDLWQLMDQQRGVQAQ
nr:probable basic-leucine zipper transcription factor K [Arachis hypogaea]